MLHHVCLVHRVKAKTKKRKIGESSSNPDTPERENPTLVTPETHAEPSEAHQDAQDEPPQHTEPAGADATTVEANPPSPQKTTEDNPHEDDITITGTGFTTPAPSNVLTKHTAKDETPLPEEKAKLDFPHYERLSAEELHAGYLSRLSASRDMEASLVGMMKKKYEVCSTLSCTLYTLT